VDEATLQAVEAELSQIQAAYGVVRIAPRSEPKSAKKKEALRGPELVPAAMPFAQDQRASIEAARQEIAATGYFTGLIPAGDYTLGPDSFTVIAGTEPRRRGLPLLLRSILLRIVSSYRSRKS
jgi:hypothetical protein